MIDKSRLITLASATAMTLALGPAMAQEQAAPAPTAQSAPAAAAPVTAPAMPQAAAPESGADAARAAMEKRWAEAMAEREQRWEQMRARAAEQGMELPETPPWAQGGAMPQMPAAPSMPEGMPMMPQGFGQMTPEERRAMRDKRWEEMRARAAEQGMELPETPPWEAAEQRQKEMMERYDRYRGIIEAMTDEQKEAISALFGGYRGPMTGPMGGQGAGPAMHRGMGRGMMPVYPPAPEMPAPNAAPAATPAPQAPAQPSS